MKHSVQIKHTSSSISPLLKLVGDESRLKLLSVLEHDSYCVSDLIKATGLSQSLISHHLKDLKDAGLVKNQRHGKWIYYTLTTQGRTVVSDTGSLPTRASSSISPLLKLISDESRLKLLSVLAHGSHCVSELVASTGLSQSLISHHLKDLKDEGLSESERSGKWMYYMMTVKGKQVISVLNNYEI